MTKTELKEMMKRLGRELRTAKHELKDAQRNGRWSDTWKKQEEVDDRKTEFRHKHIAYCMLKGRSLGEIENRCDEDNQPNLTVVEKFMDEFRRLLKEGDGNA